MSPKLSFCQTYSNCPFCAFAEARMELLDARCVSIILPSILVPCFYNEHQISETSEIGTVVILLCVNTPAPWNKNILMSLQWITDSFVLSLNSNWLLLLCFLTIKKVRLYFTMNQMFVVCVWCVLNKPVIALIA